MASFVLSNKAVDNLESIGNYTFDIWSENQADQYYYMLLDNCNSVASNRHLGKIYSGVHSYLFGFNAGRHIIFYSLINDSQIRRVRILLEQMDIKNRIKEQ